MKYITNILLIVLIACVVGLYFKSGTVQQLVGTVSSPVGTTFSTARVAQINITPTTGTATSTGLLNTDSSDRYIESLYAACSGVGISQAAYTGTGLTSNGWTITAATGTSQAPNTISNTNTIFTSIATTTPDSFASTTSMTNLTRVWATGSYLNFAFNATNTAACTAGVHYVGS